MNVGKKVQKGISDSDEIKYYLCVKCWLCKQEVAISVPTGISILFSFLFAAFGAANFQIDFFGNPVMRTAD